MRSFFIILVLLASGLPGIGQKCDCLSNLKWLEETFSKNDAGFQYVVDKKGKEAYLQHNRLFEEKAAKIKNKKECQKLLNDWTKFFRKGHIGVAFNNKSNVINDKKELTEKEIKELYKNTPKYEINYKQFETYISKLNTKSGFEGIWYSKPYTIGIIKDDSNSNREYVGFIINSETPYWQKNQIKLEIFKNHNGKYFMKYYMLNHSSKRLDDVEIIGNNYLVAGFVLLKRIKPVLKTDYNIELYVKSIYAEKPFLEKISDNTLLLRIPSFDRSQKKYIDSLLETNDKLICNTKNLIIDLRNNGGGSDASYEKIIPHLYTNPIREVGVMYLSTKLNNQRMEKFINDPNFSEDDKKWAKEALEKLNKHLGVFVNVSDDSVEIVTFDTIYPYPKNVAVLINSYCASSTEQFLLTAKQSKKVKLFGTSTYGSLDFSNMYYVTSPCDEYTLWYTLTKSFRIPEMAIDGKGIQPDFYFDKTIKPYEWINKAESILNYKCSDR